MGKSSRAGERGFTLAGVLVILTIVMVFVAYTVPKQWSTIMRRERELQTIYVMKQYARACREFNKKHSVYPSSIDQLKEARLPRFLRGPKDGMVDPLTGEVDWLIIPASAAPAGGGTPGAGGQTVGGSSSGSVQTPGGAMIGVGGAAPQPSTTPRPGGSAGTTTGGSTGTTGSTGTAGNGGQQTLPGIPIKDYAGGPFVGVRPSKTGESLLEFRGAKNYEQWNYTAIDLEAEINLYFQGLTNSIQWK